jgi:hypothetical protein
MAAALTLLPKRYASKVRVQGECWIWTGCILKKTGYGRIHLTVNGKAVMMLAHRAVYELLVGPIPEGMTLDHKCHDPKVCRVGTACPHRACINPAHLEPATGKANTLRSGGPTAINAAKVVCIKGHPLVWNGRQRLCEICSKETIRRYHLSLPKDLAPKVPATHCRRGHAFTPENTNINHGSQHCRVCSKIRMDKFLIKKRRMLDGTAQD